MPEIHRAAAFLDKAGTGKTTVTHPRVGLHELVAGNAKSAPMMSLLESS